MTTCNISIGRVYDASQSESIEIANTEAQNEGYEYFSFGSMVYITRNPICFSQSKDKTGFEVSDLVQI